MTKSRTGQAIRATAQDARAARVLGIDTDKVYMLTFALNSAICGIAGVLVSMIWVLQPFYGIVYSLRTFAIVTAAGLGNLPGVIGMSFVSDGSSSMRELLLVQNGKSLPRFLF